MNLIKIKDSEKLIKIFDNNAKAKIALQMLRKAMDRIESDKKYMYWIKGRKLYGSVWKKIEPDANLDTNIGSY